MARPSIDRRVIEHLARLSSISLDASETDTMVRELEAIVAYVEEIGSVDTSEVASEPPRPQAAWREDVVTPSLPHAEALREAPEVVGEGFAVPTFVKVTGG